MRLLNVETLEFTDFHNDERPTYAIASHRWQGAEAFFQDVQSKRNTYKSGYKKIEHFAKFVRKRICSVKWLWIDTCCINKDSAAELSEAINSMFNWYRDAEVCLAYLEDFSTTEDVDGITHSNWFTRGWTLQELIAPRLVVFLDHDWEVIGHKGILASYEAHRLKILSHGEQVYPKL